MQFQSEDHNKQTIRPKPSQEFLISSQDASQWQSKPKDEGSIRSKSNISDRFQAELDNVSLKPDFAPAQPEEQVDSLKIPIKCEIQSQHEELFSTILEMDGFTQDSIIESLTIEMNKRQVFRAGEGAGASGSFFFFSFDHRFIIKTLNKEEVKLLDLILPDYLKHITDRENQSMLARIYGIFTIKTNYFVPLNVMIMQNTYQSSARSDCVLKFDLKGSTVARNVRNVNDEAAKVSLSQAKNELDFFKIVQTNQTLKDVNYTNLNRVLKEIQVKDR